MKSSFDKQLELIAYGKFLDQCLETGHFPALLIGCTMSPKEAEQMEPKRIIVMASVLYTEAMIDTIEDAIIANHIPDKFVPFVKSEMGKALLDGFKEVIGKRLLKKVTRQNFKNIKIDDSPLKQTNNEN